MSRSRARTAVGVIPYGQHRPRVAPSAFVAPGAWVIGRVTLEQDASVWFGAVVRADMGLGRARVFQRRLVESVTAVAALTGSESSDPARHNSGLPRY